MKFVSNWVIWFAVTGLLGASVIVIRTQNWYTPGSDLGYNLGLVGGILMLALFAYPLKKRIRAFQRTGPSKPWFIFHMVCGIVGPLLIIFHSTFRFGSENATIATISMLLVVGSGIVGRFIYVHVHDGLSDHEFTLDELEGDEESEALSFNRDMHWAPDVIAMMMNFRDDVKRPGKNRADGVVRFVTLPLLERRVRKQCHRALSVHLDKRGVARQWDTAKRGRRGRQFDALVARYTTTVKRAAQLDAYKRLFSLWHVVHVPFIYLLVASAIYHVVAVHMY